MNHDPIADLLALLAQRRGVDFRDHRRESIEKGIGSRLRATGLGDVTVYTERVSHDEVELDRLLEAVVVPFSSFFRDRAVFEALEEMVIPEQLANTAGPLRTWVAGAATGEEAWSWAMLMVWCREIYGGPPFELLASDVDARSLGVAKQGRYPAAASANVPPRFNQRFLTAADDDVVVANELRGRVIFAQHDLMSPRLTPPEAILASFQIISFRNVLIYLDRRMQRKALERLRSILKPDGVLVLGGVETLPRGLQSSFSAYPGTDPALHIFRLVG